MFGTDEVGILPIKIGMKEAKAAALQLRLALGPAGGEINLLKTSNEF